MSTDKIILKTITSNLVTDVNTLDNFIITSVSKLVSSVLTLVGVRIVMIMIDPILGILILSETSKYTRTIFTRQRGAL